MHVAYAEAALASELLAAGTPCGLLGGYPHPARRGTVDIAIFVGRFCGPLAGALPLELCAKALTPGVAHVLGVLSRDIQSRDGAGFIGKRKNIDVVTAEDGRGPWQFLLCDPGNLVRWCASVECAWRNPRHARPGRAWGGRTRCRNDRCIARSAVARAYRNVPATRQHEAT